MLTGSETSKKPTFIGSLGFFDGGSSAPPRFVAGRLFVGGWWNSQALIRQLGLPGELSEKR